MINITVYSHGCSVVPENETERKVIASYIMGNLVQYDKNWDNRRKRATYSPKAVYAASTTDRREFRFLLRDLTSLLEHIEFSSTCTTNVTHVDEFEPVKIDIKWLGPSPWKEQPEALEHVFKKGKTTRVLEAATGFGKTYCGYYTAAKLEQRTAFIMEPTHIMTWIKDMEKYTTVTKEEVVSVQGTDNLHSLISMVSIGEFKPKFIFLSAPTLRNFIKEYEEATPLEVSEMIATPETLFRVLGVGLVIRDEAHEAIHALCKLTMYTDVKLMLCLSATLVSDDAFINRMYNKVFPEEDRWTSKPNRHTNVRSMVYRTGSKAKIKAMGAKGYSHIKYEQSILKNKSLSEEYWDFTKWVTDESYIDRYKEGHKALYIVSTIPMAKWLSEKITKHYPDKSVGCYVAGANKEELYERDMVVSTPGGAGTGKDIPDLSCAYNTVAMGSTQRSRQIMGRTREMVNYEGEYPYYYMFYDWSIPAHRGYESKRAIDCAGRCKSYKKIDTGKMLGLTTNKNTPVRRKGR